METTEKKISTYNDLKTIAKEILDGVKNRFPDQSWVQEQILEEAAHILEMERRFGS